jgi:hypothetical protein
MLTLFITAALLGGAAAYTTIPAFIRAWPVDIQASAEFTPADAQVIARVAQAWNAALGSAAIRVWRSPGLTTTVRDGVSTLSKHGGPGGGTYLWANYGYFEWRVVESDTYVSRALAGNSLYNTVLHELGHALGLEHNDSSPIMRMKLLVAPNGEPLPMVLIPISGDDVAGIRTLVRPPRGSYNEEGETLATPLQQWQAEKTAPVMRSPSP